MVATTQGRQTAAMSKLDVLELSVLFCLENLILLSNYAAAPFKQINGRRIT